MLAYSDIKLLSVPFYKLELSSTPVYRHSGEGRSPKG